MSNVNLKRKLSLAKLLESVTFQENSRLSEMWLGHLSAIKKILQKVSYKYLTEIFHKLNKLKSFWTPSK